MHYDEIDIHDVIRTIDGDLHVVRDKKGSSVNPYPRPGIDNDIDWSPDSFINSDDVAAVVGNPEQVIAVVGPHMMNSDLENHVDGGRELDRIVGEAARGDTDQF